MAYPLRFPFVSKPRGGSSDWSLGRNAIFNPEFFDPTTGAAVNDASCFKVWNGSSYDLKPVKTWNGSSWVTKPVKRWNGSSWITIPATAPATPPSFYWTVTPGENKYTAGTNQNFVMTTGLINVPANGMMVVILYGIRDNSSTAAIRNSWSITTFDGTVWTRRVHVDPDGTKTFGAVYSIWTANFASSASVQPTFTTDISQPMQLTSHTFVLSGPTTYGFGATATSSTLYSASTAGLYLSATPAATSLVIGSRVYNDNGSFTIMGTAGGPEYVELYDGLTASVGYGQIHTQIANYTGPSAGAIRQTPTQYVSWDDFDSLDRGAANIFYCRTAALEITGS